MNPGLIQELFTTSVDRYPMNVAIICGEKKVTYIELEEETNKLANFLANLGTARGSRVAIFAQDSIRSIVSILGVLKAGCVFVPLDAGIPVKRLAVMIEDVKPQLFLVESGLIGKLLQVAGNGEITAKSIIIDEVETGEENRGDLNWIKGYREYCNAARPEVNYDPDDMCYIYFTSGSTGRPKGIAGRLKGGDHFIRWEVETLGLVEKTRVSHLLPLTFDPSLRDILAPLCSGGTVCVPPSRETVLNAPELLAWINQHRIEVAQFVPTLLRTVLNEK